MAVRIQTSDIDIAAEVAALVGGRTDVGAVVTFTGLVRGHAGGRRLASMSLEHYPGMTELELARVEAMARERWPLQASLIVHRIGTLLPGDTIVLVVACSAHRHAAFEAASFLMDYLKTDAPFWKQETDSAGNGQWVEARDIDTTARDRWADTGKTR